MYAIRLVVSVICLWRVHIVQAHSEELVCLAGAGDSCRHVGGDRGEDVFMIDGQNVIISHGSKYFHMTCLYGTALDFPALPSFTTERKVEYVGLSGCLLPNGSIKDALAERNLTLCGLESCKLELVLPGDQSAVSASHLTGLEHLTSLHLEGTEEHPGTTSSDFFTALPNLHNCDIKYMTFTNDTLQKLPHSLVILTLFDTLNNIPEEVFNLPNLSLLHVNSKGLVTTFGNNFNKASKLRVVTIDARTASIELGDVVSPGLRALSLRHWLSENPLPIQQCDTLEELELLEPAVNKLPIGWVAACGQLLALKLENATHIKQLPREFLANTSELTTFRFRSGKLEALPPDLFYYSPKLQSIDLRGNLLLSLSSDTFTRCSSLQSLNLSNNKMQPEAVEAITVPALHQLRRLDLSKNLDLRDLCTQHGRSNLWHLKKLEVLSLAYTHVTSICSDWRINMPLLELLNLQHTLVSQLQYSDLDFNRTVFSEVLLQGAPIRGVFFSRDDYQTEMQASSDNVTIKIDAVMNCDCGMYWTWRTLTDKGKPLKVTIDPLLCHKNYLSKLTEDTLNCTLDCGDLPPGCKCNKWAGYFGRYRSVDCENANLTTMPPSLQNITRNVELLLANNMISSIQFEELPPKIKRLDLRNNNLKTLDPDMVYSLFDLWISGGLYRRLSISQNPLSCTCNENDTLNILRENYSLVEDYEAVTCSDGLPLSNVELSELCFVKFPLLLILGLVVLLITTVSYVTWLGRRQIYLAYKLIRYFLGLSHKEDEDRIYDAFVSFSHGDEEFVLELVKWLEGKSYKLCLHYRDWTPGRSIPEQISESVMKSGRTLALVSTNFLKSTWARAEFREAHAYALRDATRRLVVVLLEDRSSLDLDDELKRYVSWNTYLQWGDPWFWDKLKLVLPRPRLEIMEPESL